MAKTHVIQIPNPKAAFELIERELPEPGRGNVEACGVCQMHTNG